MRPNHQSDSVAATNTSGTAQIGQLRRELDFAGFEY
jgi:hypothetical protein